VSPITLTTDFGVGSHYVAAMKGVILSLHPAAAIVDVTHAVPAQDVRHGAVILEDVAPLFPADSIHVAVVDPGVGTDRAIVYARIGRQNFVAPDNGLLSRLARRTPPSKMLRLDRPEYWRHPVSSTFHGRDIMAPVAARLSLGAPPEAMGTPVGRLVDLAWPEVQLSPRGIVGSVILVDSFGNLITDITAEMLSNYPCNERTRIACGSLETPGIRRTYGDLAPGALAALVGSSGRLELALVGGNAAVRFGIKAGTPVAVRWD
jgi:hypothetical protein